MTTAPVAGLYGLGFSLGDRVEVLSFKRWRPGRVLALGRARVFVAYTTREGVVLRDGWFNATRVRRRPSSSSTPAAEV